MAAGLLAGFPVGGIGIMAGRGLAGIISLAFPATFPVLATVLGVTGLLAGTWAGVKLGNEIYDSIVGPKNIQGQFQGTVQVANQNPEPQVREI